MKKIAILLITTLLIFGCTHKVKREEIKGLRETDYQTLSQLMKENKEFMLYIGRPDCGDCQQFEPLLQEYLKKHQNAGLYYLNIKAYRDKAMSKQASEEEKKFYTDLRKTFSIKWTPSIEIISKGHIKKTYQYLNEDYYLIKDRDKQIQKRKEFEKSFENFMNDYFENK